MSPHRDLGCSPHAYNDESAIDELPGGRTVTDQQRLRLGLAAIAGGLAILTLGVMWAHFTELSPVNQFEEPIYEFIPRGWIWTTIGQIIAITGAQIAMIGVVVAFVWERHLTWARASIGASIFVLQAIIIFGMIPNQWLTLTQSQLEWTPQKIAFTLPRLLTLNNEVTISYAVIKDVVSAGYASTALLAWPFIMVWWQKRELAKKDGPPPVEISAYGRPMAGDA